MTAHDRLLIATHTYAATGAAAGRQDASIASLRALDRAVAADLQFADAPHRVDGLETIAALRHDSSSVTGRPGPRKGILREMFDVLAREAKARGACYFCFTNADIIWSQAAVDWVLEGGRQAYLFSRRNFDAATGADEHIEVAGVDAVAIDADWWRANRHRFRDYIVGEICWDNVYSSILMCHADAALENARGLLRHPSHPTSPLRHPPFADYIRYLTALDAGYFRLWCRYWAGLETMRKSGASPEEEARLAREVFVWRPALGSRIVQAARNVKAVVRYRAARLGIR